MQLSDSTIEVLKNFATIQNSIVFREGSVVSTISAHRAVVARAEIDELFSRDVPISEGLTQLLGSLSLFDSRPEITLEDTFMRVSHGKQSLKFLYSDESFIIKPRVDPMENDAKVGYDFSFVLTDAQLTSLKKAASIHGLPHLVVRGDAGKVSVVACDATGKSGSSDNEYSLDVEVDQTIDASFHMVLKIGNIQFLKRDYVVHVAASQEVKITKWESTTGETPVIYWAVIEAELSYYRGA